MDDMAQVLNGLVGELRGLRPALEQVVTQANARMREFSSRSLDEAEYARVELPVAISLEAAKKILLIIDNNLFYLETISVLGLTRYLFEILLWLRAIRANPLRSIEFFVQIYDDQQKHIERYMKRLSDEADFFDELHKLDRMPKEVLDLARSDPTKITPEFVQQAIAAKEEEVDRQARRRFILYRRAARTNGYSFQAYLIREKALKTAQEQLNQLVEDRANFERRVGEALVTQITVTAKGKRLRWSWKEEADAVGMIDAYDFIYGYTSRLLHATPVSFYTKKKNLDMEEMETFLEFSYVSILDFIEIVETLARN